MPRVSRKISSTYTYHVIIRGIDKNDIFLDNSDKKFFLTKLVQTKEKYYYEIYAYCLMDNHVHILMKDEKNNISKIMQSLSISYSNYFNKKYQRVGHLFQNRFISKNVENQRYLLVVQKYIHQNPQIAKISRVEKYIWSSYKEYVGEQKICNTTYILSQFDNIDMFKKFTLNGKYDISEIYETEGILRLSDEEAIKLIKRIAKIKNPKEILEYDKIKRNEIICKVKKLKIINNSQFARILGVNRKVIERIK